MKRRYTAAAAMMMVMGLCASASAAYDENLNDYTLDTMVVEADAVKNKFGDTITEQSYYRTGGDVKVITREEIEKRHYTDLTEESWVHPVPWHLQRQQKKMELLFPQKKT